MTVSEDIWFEVEVYYVPAISEGGKDKYISTADNFEEAEELVLEDCAKYYGTDEHRDPNNYKFIKNCEDPRDIENQDESWSETTIEEVQEFVSNSELPMTDGEFHRWANPSVLR